MTRGCFRGPTSTSVSSVRTTAAIRNLSLNGRPVHFINADLTTGRDLTKARRLAENLGAAFEGDKKGGPFEIDATAAESMLAHPNPDGRDNRDVVRRWTRGSDITGRSNDMWIIDFGVDMPEAEAALYEAPFEHVRRLVH